MINAEEKLGQFRENLLSETEKKAKKLINQAQKESAQMISAASDKYRALAEKEIADGKSAIQGKHTKELAALRSQAQKDILSHRLKLVESVFEAVEFRLKEFAGSKEYGKYLRGLIEKCKNDSAAMSGEIRLSAQDIGRKDELLGDAANGFSAIEDASIVLGGLKIKPAGKNIVCDYSFDTALELQREAFGDSCNLRIE